MFGKVAHSLGNINLVTKIRTIALSLKQLQARVCGFGMHTFVFLVG
jgi:hypothetical protein